MDGVWVKSDTSKIVTYQEMNKIIKIQQVFIKKV